MTPNAVNTKDVLNQIARRDPPEGFGDLVSDIHYYYPSALSKENSGVYWAKMVDLVAKAVSSHV